MSKITILYSRAENTPYKEYVDDRLLSLISGILKENGFIVNLLAYSSFDALKHIARFKPSVIFNLAYGFTDHKKVMLSQADITAQIETLKIPIIGSSSATQSVLQDKLKTQIILEKNSILCPRIIRNLELGKIYISKPRFGAAHRGIKIIEVSDISEKYSILSSNESNIVQEFIDGKEYTVGIIGNDENITVLPPLAISFNEDLVTNKALGLNKSRISYSLDNDDEYGLREISRKVYEIFGMKNYARIDYRVKEGNRFCLDVNALPNLCPIRSFLPNICSLAKISYEEMILRVINSAMMKNNLHSVNEIH